ncbi:MAG: MBL fold metallo-hydrolase [Epulopiscium sp.]|nr:MBL fold metallo-hydrolase [Candidatus Epulonipiscium sp.]
MSLILLMFTLVACDINDIEDVTNLIEQFEDIAKDTKVNEEIVNVDGEMQVHFLDVGQGDSALIICPNGESILIDGGEKKYGDYIVDYLNKLGIEDIDVVIATHPHSDHIGGLITVFENFNIKSVYTPRVTHTTKTYEEFVLAVQNQDLKFKEVKAGQGLEIQGIETRFLGPVDTYGDDLNNWSAVIKINYKNTSFLFTGDAEIKSENDIISSDADIEATVLKIGHHGSDTSSGDDFLDMVNPKYAVISAGVDNKYGHPHRSILDKINNKGIKLYRTDLQGSIIAFSDGKDLTFTTD